MAHALGVARHRRATGVSGVAVTARHALPLNSTTHWIRYAPQINAFVVGDANKAWIVAPDGRLPVAVSPDSHGLTLPVSDELLGDLLHDGWNGFRFPPLDALRDAKRHDAIAGDLLRHLAILPDYGQLVEHPFTGAWLALRSGRMTRVARESLSVLAEVRTRGKPVLTFAAHPTLPLVFYGDNAGAFAMHALTDDGFARAATIAKLERKASHILVRANGTHLLLGGMGYLTQVVIGGKAARQAGSCMVTVRSLHALDADHVLVNAGLQGLALVRCADASLDVQWRADVGEPVHQLAVARDQCTIAMVHQGSGTVTLGSLL